MIKAVLFDIDGVLLDSFEANLKFFQDLLPRFGYPPPSKEEYVNAFHLHLINAIKFLTQSTDEEEINKICHAGRNREVPYRIELLKMPEGVKTVLDTLIKKYKLGIVTSRGRRTTYEAPQLSKLQEYFQTTISYEDTMKHKPNPEPLLLATKRLKVKPEESVYVGDVKNDAIAAKVAGMKAIIYSKTKIEGADYCTDSFLAIPRLIDSLN